MLFSIIVIAIIITVTTTTTTTTRIIIIIITLFDILHVLIARQIRRYTYLI